MAAIASVVLTSIICLWDNIRRCFSYEQIYRRNLSSLGQKSETLRAHKKDVDRRVEEAESKDEVIMERVNDWRRRADTLLNEELPAFQKNGREKARCFSYCCWRYQRIEGAQSLVSRFDAVIGESEFERVSEPRPLPAPQLGRSTSIKYFEETIIEDAVNKVRQALSNDTFIVIGVYGTGGVGKTTLVTEVAVRAAEERLYNRVVFATVSKSPNVEKIQKQIAESLGLVLGADQRADRIKSKIMREKKVLIVLDDLWEELKLRDVGVPSGADLTSCQSKIVITTRDERVCNDMNCHEKFRLDTWPPSESRDFFKRTAGTKFDSDVEFEDTADLVADQCGGLPLALVAVAKALGDKDFEEWKKALRRLEQSMHLNGDHGRKVYNSIKLSYDYLETKEQTCFLTCCLFPEDHNIWKEELARYVFGLGLFPQVNTVEEARGETETIAKKLIASGLLLHGEKEEQVKMHDVIRDVAIQITSIEDLEESSRTENRIQEKQVFMVQTGNHPLREWPIRDTYESYTAISFMSHDINELPDCPICPKLQTLLVQDNKYLEKIPSTFFEKMNALRVLDLSRTQASSFPESIRSLKMLRTLHLDNSMFTDVSALEALQQLAILSLKESEVIKELPQDMGKLINLRMLDLTSSSDVMIKPNVLLGLLQLEELYMRGSFAKWQNETDVKTSGNAPFLEVINLRRLVILKVDIADAKCLPRNVKSVPSWWKFDICVCKEDRIRWKNIQLTKQNSAYSRNLFLDTSTKNLPDWFITAASEKTKKLTYTKCTKLNLLEEHDCGRLANLKFLVVEDCLDIEYLMLHPKGVASNSKPVFKGLQELRIHDTKIKEICNVELPGGSLENLKLLEIQQCNDLHNSLLPSNLVERLSNLERLRADTISTEEVFGFENLEEGLYLGRLAELRLVNLGELKNMWKGPARFADFTNLKLVSVIKCVKLTNLFSVSITEGLSNLEDLWVEECSEMKEIIQNEDGITLERVKLPKLKTLCLKNLPLLSSFYAENVVLECPSLEHLHVKNCQMFRTPASDFNSLKQVKENDEQHMNILKKRMKEPEY